MTTFQFLICSNAASLVLLGVSVRALWLRRDAEPEVSLSRRAFAAARTTGDTCQALGPLFQGMSRASRNLLRRVVEVQHGLMQVRQRRHRQRLWVCVDAVRLAFGETEPRELAELRHTVEQLEALADALSRYHAGLSRLADVAVPLRCVDDELRPRRCA